MVHSNIRCAQLSIVVVVAAYLNCCQFLLDLMRIAIFVLIIIICFVDFALFCFCLCVLLLKRTISNKETGAFMNANVT